MSVDDNNAEGEIKPKEAKDYKVKENWLFCIYNHAVILTLHVAFSVLRLVAVIFSFTLFVCYLFSSLFIQIQTRDIDGRATPFYNFTMDNGTPCDINNNKPRRVDILYICHPTSNNEVRVVFSSFIFTFALLILLCLIPYFHSLLELHCIFQLMCESPTSNIIFTYFLQVMSVKEVSTCEYEVIILTPHLCENPAFMYDFSLKFVHIFLIYFCLW